MISTPRGVSDPGQAEASQIIRRYFCKGSLQALKNQEIQKPGINQKANYRSACKYPKHRRHTRGLYITRDDVSVR
jgi:hypothetical protein